MRWDRANRPVWLGYILSALAVAIAVLVRLALFGGPGARGPFVTFYPAVFVAALFGGVFAGLLATTVCALYAIIWWNPVPYPLDWSVLIIFVGTGIFVSFVTSVLHRAETRGREADKRATFAAERERAAVSIQKSEEQWKRTFDAMPEAIAVLDTEHRIVKVNEQMARRLGTEPRKCVGLHCYEVVHGGATGPPKFCPHALALRDGGEHAAEVHAERLGGDFLVSATPLFNEQGEMVGAIHVARDITESKKMEATLRESEERLRLLGNNLPDSALYQYSHDSEGGVRFHYLSAGIERLNGVRAEEVLSDATIFRRQILPEYYQRLLEVEARSAAEMSDFDMEVPMHLPNGQTRWMRLHSRPRIMPDGRAMWDGVQTDITDRKLMEEELRKSRDDLELRVKERTKELTEANNALINANRAFQTLSECNQAMVRQTEETELLKQVCQIVVNTGGYCMAWVGFAEDDEYKTVRPIVSAGYDDGYLEEAKITWADTERGRGPTGTAIRTCKIIASQNALTNPAYTPWRSEGTNRGYASSIALPLIVERNVIGALTLYSFESDAFDEEESILLSNLAENLSHGIASIRFAEQRVRTGEELREYASRLEVINGELQDFAFAASHDLQEPLRKIQTFCDLAIKRCAHTLDTASQEYLTRAVNSASRMRDLLHGLLQFSMVAAPPGPVRKIGLNSLMRGVVNALEPLIVESGCRVEVEDLPDIEGDENQMLQLLVHLVGNAIKFRGDRIPHIKIYGKSHKKEIYEIFIEDNGIGFNQQFSERIFKPFRRLHGRSVYDGAGMGLAICRKIAERHGGTIRAESEPGKGSTFIVRLPVKQAGVERISGERLS